MADLSRDDLWRPRDVQRLAREFADLAAAELTRCAGPVRPADFVARTRRLLRHGATPNRLPAAARAVAEAGLHINHPRYMAQQVAAPIPAAALVESLVAALNQSIAVVRMSPAGTLVDRAVLAEFRRRFGYPAAAEGSLVPGGSFANLTALLAARAALAPQAWQHGGGRIAVLAGAQTHYSISRAAGILGLGTDAVFSIPMDGEYRTDAGRAHEAFAAARRAGYRKFVLIGTCGSTSTGSCDDLRALAAVVRRGAFLRRAFSQHAPYLFRGSAAAPAPNVGEFTIACSQRFDALKIWLVEQAYGGAFLGSLIEGVCDAALAAYEHCRRSSILEPAHRPECNIFCFRLRHPPRSAAAADRLHAALEDAVNASGEAYISSTVLAGRRVLRIVVMNPRTTPRDTQAVMKLVERLAVGRRRR